MDADEWDSDGEFEATIIEMEAKEAEAVLSPVPSNSILSPVPSNSRVTAEPIQPPKCSTPRNLASQITNGLSLSLSTISYVNSPNITEHLQPLKKSCLDLSAKKKRKFPGPAGALPKLKKDVDIRSLKNSNCVESAPEEDNSEVVVSQSSQALSVSSYPSWNCLVEELQLSKEHLHRHSIAHALHNASKKQLPEGKVPLLAVVVISINKSLPDATVSLKDLTGTISGVIHRMLIKEHRERLKVGSALLLKQVAVFSPSRRRQYLNITPNNLLHVYFEQEKTADVESISVAKLTVPLETLLTQPVSCSAPKIETAGGGVATLATGRNSRLLNTVTSSCSTPKSTSWAERVEGVNPRSLGVAQVSEIGVRLSTSGAGMTSMRLTNACTNTSAAIDRPDDTNQHLFDDDDLDDLDLDF